MKLVECVPNFSEGRDSIKIKQIVQAAEKITGVVILDVENDKDHNRSVLSFVAPPESALEACFEVAKKSAELIDLNHHQGEHPRMGAVDVIPFIPVSETTIEECVALAQKLGEKIGRELQVPVYLYDHAARIPERKDLAAVRKGQFEGLRDLIGKDPARTPDFGPNHIHSTAGAVAVGAREQIINFNLNLSTHDMVLGKEIARKIRTSGGGLPSLRAKEIDLAERKQVQISTVLTNYKVTSIKKVMDEVSRLTSEKGAYIQTTEIVGLLPRESLTDFAASALNLENFNPKIQILENRLEDLKSKTNFSWAEAIDSFSAALSNTDPVPGGGAAAAASGAFGCSLGLMALGLSLKSKKLDPEKRPILESATKSMNIFLNRFKELAQEDAAVFQYFMSQMALPKDDPKRSELMEAALERAAAVPLETLQKAVEAEELIKEILSSVSPTVSSDAKCARHLLKSAAHCAYENVTINVQAMKNRSRAEKLFIQAESFIKSLS